MTVSFNAMKKNKTLDIFMGDKSESEDDQ